MRTHAFEIPVLPQRLAKGGERLVERICRDRAYGAPEDVGLNETNDVEKFIVGYAALGAIVIDLQQEGISDLDSQLAQIWNASRRRGRFSLPSAIAQ